MMRSSVKTKQLIQWSVYELALTLVWIVDSSSLSILTTLLAAAGTNCAATVAYRKLDPSIMIKAFNCMKK